MLWINSFPDMVPQPYHMRSNNTNMNTGKHHKNIYMRYNISYSTTESHHTWNNSSVRSIQQCKKRTNRILNRTAPPHLPLSICLFVLVWPERCLIWSFPWLPINWIKGYWITSWYIILPGLHVPLVIIQNVHFWNYYVPSSAYAREPPFNHLD